MLVMNKFSEIWYNITMGYTYSVNIRNNQRILAAIAFFMMLSLFANIYYYTGGKDILSQSTSRDVSIVYANEINSIEQINVEDITITEDKVSQAQADFDSKVAKVHKYLSLRGAPLAQYSQELVKAAEHYGIDYRLVAAISIIESSGGKHNFRTYNAWGWGKSGFESWEDGIWTVSKGLSTYYAKGMTTPKAISYSYCPPNANSWANKVSYVMNMISNQ